MFPEEPAEYIHHVDEMCHGKKFFPKIQKVFVEIEKFFELENAGTSKDDDSEAAQWLRAIKAIVKEEPVPQKILSNETFQKLLSSVELTNFEEELFNLEVKNMTDLKAQHEIGFAEGKEQGFAEGKTEGFAEGKTEGFAEGKAEGFNEGEKAERARAEKEKRKLAKGLREDGVPLDIIARRTGFSAEEIEKI